MLDTKVLHPHNQYKAYKFLEKKMLDLLVFKLHTNWM